MSLKSTDTDSINSIDHIAVCIQKISADQRHLGIIYKEEGAHEIRFLHLAWHYVLQDESAPTNATWVESDLNSTLRKQIWAYISLLSSSPPRIPYGFEDYSESLDPTTGTYLKTDEGEGLTCATFVLAVFEAQGIEIVNRLSWPSRDNDKEWQKNIIDMLENRLQHPDPDLRVSQEHINKMKESIGMIRIRPEEVAGAFGIKSKDWAIDSSQAIAAGESIVNQLNAA